jgi:hypothetical protein
VKGKRTKLRYVGICQGGPWHFQEIRAELPVITTGLPEGCQYFHENDTWFFETPETMYPENAAS